MLINSIHVHVMHTYSMLLHLTLYAIIFIAEKITIKDGRNAKVKVKWSLQTIWWSQGCYIFYVQSVSSKRPCWEAAAERRCSRRRTCCQLMPLFWSLRCAHGAGMPGCPGDGYRADRGPDRSWPTLLHQLCQLTVNWTLNGSDTYAAFLCFRP